MKKALVAVVILFFSSTIIINAQKIQNPVIQNQIQGELEKRGLQQSEVEKRLKQKGIDLNNINPADAPKVEKQIKMILDELEAEKAAKNKPNYNKEKVDEGQNNEVDISKEAPFENTNKNVKSNINPKTNAREVTEKTAEDITKAIKEGDAVDVVVAEKLDDIKQTTVLAPVYGMHVFRNKSIGVFRKVDDVKAADNYVLGVGDQLAVSIWGVAEYEGVLTINKDGYVQPDRMERMYLKGMTYGKARDLLRAKFAKYYPFKSESFSVAVNYARTITVNIYGEVFTPGGYSIPATNTAFNAMVAAGGPSDVGSVRKIKLLREGAKAREIDVYEFMNNPAVRDKFYLEDNDIIHVPIAERVVSVQGAIRRPYKYELLPSENLIKLIDFAGGLADSAYTEIIQVKRYENDKQVLIDVKYKDLKANNGDFTLLPGDIVMINSVEKAYDNYVSITGAVDYPKSYELLTGMKISDLIRKGVLSKEARTDVAFFQRSNPDGTVSYQKINIADIISTPSSSSNIELKRRDKLIIYSLDKYADRYEVSVKGAVRKEQKYPYDPNQTLRVEDAILLAGGLAADATDIGYIMRNKPEDPTAKEYIRINVRNAMLNRQSSDNAVLKPTDELLVLSINSFRDAYQVKIEGAVRNPGAFQYNPTLTLKDVLTLSGGLRLDAANNRIEVSRIVMNNSDPTRTIIAILTVDENLEVQGNGNYKLEPFDQIMVRSVPEFGFQKTITINGEVRYPGTYTLSSKNETLKSVIERAGGLTTEAFQKGAQLYRKQDDLGFVVMDLAQALGSNDSRYNYIMKEGDVITIPKSKDFVTIQGATQAQDLYIGEIATSGQISTPFHKGRSARFYVEHYTGGFTKESNRNKISVIHPNGRVIGTTNLGLFKIYPKPSKGSIIRVAYKEQKREEERGEKKEKVDWEKLFANTIAQASGILTLILLAQQLSK
jgi:protein involved in polysaccharide export with SLBB domain